MQSNHVPSIQPPNALFARLQSHTSFDIDHYLRTTNQLDLLTQILIRREQFRMAIRELEQRGIDFATLFPDLKGAAVAANANHMVQTFMSQDTAEDSAFQKRSTFYHSAQRQPIYSTNDDPGYPFERGL